MSYRSLIHDSDSETSKNDKTEITEKASTFDGAEDSDESKIEEHEVVDEEINQDLNNIRKEFERDRLERKKLKEK